MLLILSLVVDPAGPRGPTPAALRIGLAPRRLVAVPSTPPRRSNWLERNQGPVIGGVFGGLFAYGLARGFRAMSDSRDHGSMLPIVGAGVLVGVTIGAMFQGKAGK